MYDQQQEKILAQIKQAFISSDIIEFYLRYMHHLKLSPEKFWQVIQDIDYQQEFTIKCQYLQHYYSKTTSINFKKACQKMLSAELYDFNQPHTFEIYQGFLHFLALNEPDVYRLRLMINRWLSSGRSIETKVIQEDIEFSPVDFAVTHNKLTALQELVNAGADITALDQFGQAAIHKLVQQIMCGKSDIKILRIWKSLRWPVDTLNGDGIRAEFLARQAGNTELTRMLGGNVELAAEQKKYIANEFVVEIKRLYNNYLRRQPQLMAKSNDFQLFAAYIIDNISHIPSWAFEALLEEPQLMLNPGVIDGKYSLLEKLVYRGSQPSTWQDKYNEWALLLLKHKRGGIYLDNGKTILHYIASSGNLKLLSQVLIARLEIINCHSQVITSDQHRFLNTPAILAILQQQTAMLIELIRHGLAECIEITRGKVHVLDAVRYCSQDKVAMLRGISPHVDLQEELAVEAVMRAISDPEVPNGTISFKL